MASEKRSGKIRSKITAPPKSQSEEDGYINTIHQKGSQSDIQYDLEKRRALVRPEIDYRIVVLNLLIPLLVCLPICWWSVNCALLGLGLYLLIRLRSVLIFFIHVYQCRASADVRLSCVFEPSCSEYAILAIKKYGAIIGGYKAIRRLFRCRPPGGIDYP